MSAESSASASYIDCCCPVVVQAWFTRLLSLLVDHPRFVKVTKGAFHNLILGQMHPLSPKLTLLVCIISARGLLSETFRETLAMSSCAPVAQLVEHRAVTREVVSSTPAGPSLRVTEEKALPLQLHLHIVRLSSFLG